MAAWFGTWLDRLAGLGALPTDSAEGRLSKAIHILAALIVGLLAFFWVGTYWALGLWLAGAIPFTYQILSIAGLVVLTKTRRFTLFRASQGLMLLLLPFLLQWALGGFVASGGVMVWAFLAPVGQLISEGPRKSGRWFAAYLALIVVSGFLEPILAPRAALPEALRIVFIVLNIGGISMTAFVLIMYFARQRAQALAALQEEQGRSESLLLNILPETVAARLKGQAEAIADGYPDATVLFADIVDFTRMSAGMTPEALVGWLNELFTTLDYMTERHGLEKIKTIGDSYMVVGGLPSPRPDHVRAVADMALDIQREAASRRAPNGEPLRLRIGMHTGPVVAGVIGARKFIYDLWGDTVNTASRMESHGVGGEIQVTAPVYELLRRDYIFSEQRVIAVKGKGTMATYLLLGRRPIPRVQ